MIYYLHLKQIHLIIIIRIHYIQKQIRDNSLSKLQRIFGSINTYHGYKKKGQNIKIKSQKYIPKKPINPGWSSKFSRLLSILILFLPIFLYFIYLQVHVLDVHTSRYTFTSAHYSRNFLSKQGIIVVIFLIYSCYCELTDGYTVGYVLLAWVIGYWFGAILNILSTSITLRLLLSVWFGVFSGLSRSYWLVWSKYNQKKRKYDKRVKNLLSEHKEHIDMVHHDILTQHINNTSSSVSLSDSKVRKLGMTKFKFIYLLFKYILGRINYVHCLLINHGGFSLWFGGGELIGYIYNDPHAFLKVILPTWSCYMLLILLSVVIYRISTICSRAITLIIVPKSTFYQKSNYTSHSSRSGLLMLYWMITMLISVAFFSLILFVVWRSLPVLWGLPLFVGPYSFIAEYIAFESFTLQKESPYADIALAYSEHIRHTFSERRDYRCH